MIRDQSTQSGKVISPSLPSYNKEEFIKQNQESVAQNKLTLANPNEILSSQMGGKESLNEKKHYSLKDMPQAENPGIAKEKELTIEGEQGFLRNLGNLVSSAPDKTTDKLFTQERNVGYTEPPQSDESAKRIFKHSS